MLRIGAGCLVLATSAAVWTGVAFASERPEPSITAGILTTHGHNMLRFEIKDSGLGSNDRMTVKIHALTTTNNGVTPTPLYSASLGPNSTGIVDHAGEVAVPPAPANELEVQAWVGKQYTCYENNVTAHTGCVTVQISRPFEKPQLTVSWRNPRHSRAGLFVFVSARDVSEHRAVLRVVDANRHRQLLVTSWPSSATGDISKAITAIIPPSTRRLCVAVSNTEPRPDCSFHPGSGNAYALTTVPSP